MQSIFAIEGTLNIRHCDRNTNATGSSEIITRAQAEFGISAEIETPIEMPPYDEACDQEILAGLVRQGIFTAEEAAATRAGEMGLHDANNADNGARWRHANSTFFTTELFQNRRHA